MKIFILRHEDRTQDCSFFAPLTRIGLDNSVKLISYLKKNNINMIYSSPFIRTLQTIYPYIKETDIKINIEYGLSEIHHEDIIPKKAVGISLPEYIAESFNYNPEYKTIVKPTDINYQENEKQVSLRIKKILREIISAYYKTDKNILLVTHQCPCNEMVKITNKATKKVNTSNDYSKGRLCLIYNNNWTFEPINF